MRDATDTVDPALREDDPNALMVVIVGAIGSLLLVVIILLLQALFFWSEEREFALKVVDERPQELREVQADALEKLNGYAWVDRDKGIVTIPIDRAMDIMVRESRGGAPQEKR